MLLWVTRRDFNPRPPRGGRQKRMGHKTDNMLNFNPRPPRGGRPQAECQPNDGTGISIHAPREGGDKAVFDSSIWEYIFQSTPPARGATQGFLLDRGRGKFQSTPPARGATALQSVLYQSLIISIHAPREGGDSRTPPGTSSTTNFNPRPPRGGRPHQSH